MIIRTILEAEDMRQLSRAHPISSRQNSYAPSPNTKPGRGWGRCGADRVSVTHQWSDLVPKPASLPAGQGPLEPGGVSRYVRLWGSTVGSPWLWPSTARSVKRWHPAEFWKQESHQRKVTLAKIHPRSDSSAPRWGYRWPVPPHKGTGKAKEWLYKQAPTLYTLGKPRLSERTTPRHLLNVYREVTSDPIFC